MQIIITGVTVSATSFNGTVTNFPMPLDATQALGAVGTGSLFDATTTPPGAFSTAPGGINAQLVSVEVSFNRVL